MFKSALFWEIIGIPVIFILGFLFHYLYEWTGYSKFMAIFAPINESVWEHLKLGIYPVLLYAIFEYVILPSPPTNFLIAKTLEVYLIPLVIIILYYTYFNLLGHNVFIIDILIYAVAIVLGQMASYCIMSINPLPSIFSMISWLGLFFIITIFTIFTFNPLNLPIFHDPSL